MRSAAVSRPLSPVPRAPAFTANWQPLLPPHSLRWNAMAIKSPPLACYCYIKMSWGTCSVKMSSPHGDIHDEPGWLSANAPALVDVATPVDLGHLDRGAVGAGFDGLDARVDRDLLGVGSVLERLAEHPTVEVAALGDVEQGQDGRRHVHVAHRRTDRRPLLEARTPGDERVADVPRAHAPVVAGIELRSPAHVRQIASRHAELVRSRRPRKREEQVGATRGIGHVNQLERERALDGASRVALRTGAREDDAAPRPRLDQARDPRDPIAVVALDV